MRKSSAAAAAAAGLFPSSSRARPKILPLRVPMAWTLLLQLCFAHWTTTTAAAAAAVATATEAVAAKCFVSRELTNWHAVFTVLVAFWLLLGCMCTEGEAAAQELLPSCSPGLYTYQVSYIIHQYLRLALAPRLVLLCVLSHCQCSNIENIACLNGRVCARAWHFSPRLDKYLELRQQFDRFYQ